MNEVENAEKSSSKNKTVGRISRLFQKKPKKKNMTSSLSSMSLSDTTLSSKPTTFQSSSSIASSSQSINNEPIETRNLPQLPTHHSDSGSIHSKLTRTMSMSSTTSIQQLISQQLSVLKDLDSQKQMYKHDNNKLSDQLTRTREKVQQRTKDLEAIQKNYQHHLRSIRSSDDDAQTIAQKLVKMKTTIRELASELVPFAEEGLTGEKLSTLWLNLGESIDRLGKPLAPERIQMLTEKFMMDVLVRNLNINLFPGLACDPQFLELSNWFDQFDDSHFFSTRLRQEISMIVVNNIHTTGSDIEQSWKKAVDSNWHYLYRGLQKAYPSYLSSKNNTENSACIQYSNKLRTLVEDTIALGSAIKGQEVSITASDVREGIQLFDPKLMEDQDGQLEGTIAFCISPPFVIKIANRYEPLVKGRVLCFPPKIPL
ncbi:uncharacterized protein EV154DRAFT_517211 [Mucor mucedo]|uniref:uncharacterized protein n=1 Tax=Mucor mucedo TaxID=29922 RepID=UPI00221F4201|nr:uncharacterized protein EV154DRAFT_517211 [Mucor mucedo]KAI7888614.1 hypothetical protein EV154DRAFT_517211 [Mucor mucedo]